MACERSYIYADLISMHGNQGSKMLSKSYSGEYDERQSANTILRLPGFHPLRFFFLIFFTHDAKWKEKSDFVSLPFFQTPWCAGAEDLEELGN